MGLGQQIVNNFANPGAEVELDNVAQATQGCKPQFAIFDAGIGELAYRLGSPGTAHVMKTRGGHTCSEPFVLHGPVTRPGAPTCFSTTFDDSFVDWESWVEHKHAK